MRRSLAPYLSRLGMLFRRWKSWPSRGSRGRARRHTRLHRGATRRLPAVGRGVEQLENKLAFSASPADPSLIADINKLPQGLPIFNPANFVAVGSTVFFTASDSKGDSGTELWKTDGTLAGTKMVADINPGFASSSPTALVSFKNSLFFTADDGVNGRELWKSDGTAAGTVIVKDVSSTAGGLDYYSASPTPLPSISQPTDVTGGPGAFGPGMLGGSMPSMVATNNLLFFVGAADETGAELWKTDGTTAGTVLVKDINMTGDPMATAPQKLTAVGNTIFFTADDGRYEVELWKSDGTAVGTVLVKNFGLNAVDWLTNVGGTLYFVSGDTDHGTELWKSNGTEAGTTLVKDINAPVDPDTGLLFPANSDPQQLTAVGSTLYFTADDGVNGRELWKSTGTAAGTVLVRNINNPADSSVQGMSGSDPSWLTAVGSTLFFSADDGLHGRELWKSTGTAASTVMVTDLNAGYDISNPDTLGTPMGSDPQWLTNVGGKLYFAANESYSPRLWKTDGTAAGTVQVTGPNGSLHVDGYSLGESPSQLTAVGSTLYFAGYSYGFDPTGDAVGGQTFLPEVVSGSTGTISVLLTADPSGKTADGIFPIYDGMDVSSSYAVLNNAVYFAANNGTTGYELWKSDGTAAGTVLVKDIFPGREGSGPFDFTVVGNTLFFTAYGTAGAELWKTDGTASGTVQVKDIAAGSESSNPHSLMALNGTLYFSATDGKSGYELWKSNGTAAGTVVVKNIRTDVSSSSTVSADSASYLSSSYPDGLVVLGNKLYFSADDGIHGRELWSTDGTAAGTRLVADVDDSVFTSGSASYAASGIESDPVTVAGNKLFFAGHDAAHGLELWQSDGTTSGTQLVADLATDFTDSYPRELTGLGDKLFFVNNNPGGLWVSDGTEQGTVQLAEAFTNPSRLTAVGSSLYFVGGDGSTFNLFVTDGTVEGTISLFAQDLINPADLRSIFGTLYFTAEDATTSLRSLYAIDPQSTSGYSLVVDGTTFSKLEPLNGAFGTVLFVGDNGKTGLELWKADAVGDKPTVTIGIDRLSFKKGDTATVSFTLSESSTSFAAGDVTVNGGSLSNFAGTGTNYTAKFTPAASFIGTGAISVASGGFLGALGLANSASRLTDELSIDTADPIVTIASDKTALKAGETATITFTLNKPSTTFTIEDVTATGGSLSNFTGSDSSYSAVFTPSASSTTPGGVSVAASKYTDLSGNPNVAGSLPVAIKIDTVIPTIAITSNKTALKIGETATITFKLSESLTGFSLASVTAGGGMLSKLAGSGTTYTATFTPSDSSYIDGSVSIAAGAVTDAAGNPSLASTLAPAIKIDTLAPSLTIVSSKESLRTGETATITFTLSESSTDFTAADVKATGGTLTNFAGSGLSYTALFTPTANSTAAGVVSVASGTFKDAVGNPNASPGSLPAAIKVDTVAPTLKITSEKAALKIGETTRVTFTTSETTTDFTLDDISYTGGLLTGFTGSGSSYSATFTPTAGSTLAGAISVAAGKFTDAAGNPNVDGALGSAIKIDTAAPTLKLTSSTGALNKSGAATITVKLSEPSTTFTASTVKLSGGTLSGFSGKGDTYTFKFVPAANFVGTGTVSVAAGAFGDTAGNPSTDGAALDSGIAIDTVVPTLSISSETSSLKAGDTATITFRLSEDSSNFQIKGEYVQGGTLSALSGSGSVYTATFTPKAGSTAPGKIAVAAAAFTDAFGNPSTAGSLATPITINTVQPTLKITSEKSALKTGETTKLTFAFSENVTEFTQDDIAYTGGLLTGFTGSGKSFSAIFSPNTASTTDGTVSVAANAARNAAGNGNPAASLATAIKIDTVLPTILITSDLSTLTAGKTAKITFLLSEASTTFIASDVTVTNGVLSAFAGTGTTYTATFTPKASFKGIGTVSVAAGKFTDKAGNNNSAGDLLPTLTINT